MNIIDHAAVATDSNLPPCPRWCDIPGRYHHDYDEGWDGYPVRWHETDYTSVIAETDFLNPDKAQPSAAVSVGMSETRVVGPELEFSRPRVVLSSENMPHFTPAEARRLAANIVAAADRADEIAGVK